MEDQARRKRWTGGEIIEMLQRVLVERVELSKVCEERGCCPSQVYRWQKELFDGGARVFERSNGAAEKRVGAAEARAAQLEAKLRRKDEVLSELMEEHIALKKTVGVR
jgi:transposase-like protein